MKKSILLFLQILFVCTLSAQQVITRTNINLRSAPTTESMVLLNIPKGTAIDLAGCASDWCEVTYNGQSGFVAKRVTTPSSEYHSLSRTGAHATEPIRHYTNSKGRTVQSPTHYDTRPAGATARCRDGSYSFSQSRRGTCSHHGGVAEWLE